MIEKIYSIFQTIENPTQLLQEFTLLLVVALIGAFLSRILLSKICQLFCKEKTFNILWKKLSSPTICLSSLGFVFILLPHIHLPKSILIDYFHLALRSITSISLLWWTLRLLDSLILLIHRKLESEEKSIPLAFLFLSRIIKGALALLFIISIMPSFFLGHKFINILFKYIGVSTISAGAIAGLALQPILKDILGGFSIITQNIFKEGDWIEFNAGRQTVSGRVTDVTLRYTKLKRWTGSFITILNSTFLSSPIDNFGRTHYTAYSLPLTPAKKGKLDIQHFLQSYRKLITASPYIDEKKCHVTVKSLAIQKMEAQFHIFFNKTEDQEKILRIHTFWQEILELAKVHELSVGMG